MIQMRNQVLAAAVLLGLLGVPEAARGEPVREVRLYTLDCGTIETQDLGAFSDTGEYDGKPGTMVVPCFVIRHPKGVLLWDTGLGDKLVASKDGVDADGFHLRVKTTLASQLAAIGLANADVTFVAFSHLHFDHTGNANAFPAATWILNKAELAWATGPGSPTGVVPATISAVTTVKTKMIDGDLDVFGDGSVRVLRTPGHTPGHQVLQLKLSGAGTVILSGDLYHTRDNRTFGRVPRFNVNRADTLASQNRIEKIVASTKARFVIQHDAGDILALPRFPAYLK